MATFKNENRTRVLSNYSVPLETRVGTNYGEGRKNRMSRRVLNIFNNTNNR